MASPVTVTSSPETIPNFSSTTPPDIATRNRADAVVHGILRDGTSPLPEETSLVKRSITSFNGTSVENLSDEQKIACAYNILRNI